MGGIDGTEKFHFLRAAQRRSLRQALRSERKYDRCLLRPLFFSVRMPGEQNRERTAQAESGRHEVADVGTAQSGNPGFAKTLRNCDQ
jgi:hypothetical protein